MSMNFAREQSLLRQRLLAKADPAAAAAASALHGAAQTYLGAPDAELEAAAADLAAAWPQMGRAQMTAFVRTLWNSKVHELRAVGARLLAVRASLLEPADLPLLEGFLRDTATADVRRLLAQDVLGAMVQKNRKLWRDLKRFAGDAGLRLAAVHAAARPLASDDDAFQRWVELVEPLLGTADEPLLRAIDEALAGAVARHRDAVQAFAARHGRKVALPRKRPAAGAASGARSKAKSARTDSPRAAARSRSSGGKGTATRAR
jgi:hypothetical protein